MLTSMVARDLTEHKAARASEERYRRLFESAKDGILILDAETGMIVDVNPFLAEMLGYSLEEFLGRHVWDLGFFRNIAASKEKFLELQRQLYVRYENLPLETAQGKKINVEFVSNVYLVGSARVIQCNIRDITQRKATEEQVRKLSLAVEQSPESIVITDADVTNFYNANKSMFNFPEPRVHLAQILVTPSPDPNVRNLKNHKAQNAAEAEATIQDLDRRIRAGEDFALLAQNYSEDPGSAPNGGDMGFHPESDFAKMPDFLKLIREMPAGSTSGIVRMQEGYRIFKMIAKEPAGQRDLNDPRTQQGIREELRSQKDHLLQGAYFEVSRNGAKIQNYLSEKVVEDADKSK